jgi:hypothetical protein
MEYNISKYNQGNYILFTEHITTFGDIYEFGVYGGRSLEVLINNLCQHNIKYRKMFGFDSFEGLPKQHSSIKSHPDWKYGNFNATKLYNCSKEDVKKQILYRTNNIPILIEGFFKKTLNTNTIITHDLGPASYINIDVDLYTSTYQILDFVFYNKLYHSGTIIRYDDWYSGEYAGEAKAHDQLTKKYNVQTKNVLGNDHIKVVV